MTGYIGFVLIIVIIVILAAISIYIKGLDFLNIQVMIMTALLALSFDMIFCKQLNTYHYVSNQYRGINSVVVCLLAFPSIWIIFISFKPNGIFKTALYILSWSTSLTLLELLITEPYKIVIYPKFSILPWSPVVYISSFYVLLAYKKILKTKLNKYKNEEFKI